MGIHLVRVAFVAGIAGTLAACHHIEATHNLCGGTTACAKDPCAPVDVISGRPNRPFRALGVVQVRVDRGTGLKNPTLRDAVPALENEARSMGADAVILTFEEFSNWYDKGEEFSPIHDLERQESWYITEKARYLSGLAVVYTGPCEPCVGMPGAMPGPMFTPTPTRPAPTPAPGTLPPPAPTPAPSTYPPAPPPSLPPGEIDMPGRPPAGESEPTPAPAPTEPAPAEQPAPSPSEPPAPEQPKPPTPTPSSTSLPPPRHIPAGPVQTAGR